MRAMYYVGDKELAEDLGDYRIKDYAKDKIPAVVCDLDYLEGHNHVDWFLYNFFLNFSDGPTPWDDCVTFCRIKREVLLKVTRLGKYELDSSIKRLQSSGWLIVLRQTGKPNAYYART